MQTHSKLYAIQVFFLYGILFLFPLFFLPITQDAFAFQKLYLIIFGVMTILIIGLIRVIIEKKITFSLRMIDVLVFVLILPYVSSIIIASPNKMQALFALPSGLVAWFFLIALYTIIAQLQPSKEWVVMKTSVLVLSIAVIIVFLMRFSFSPLGNYLETAVFIGFFIVLVLLELIKSPYEKRKIVTSIVLLIVYSTACILSVRTVLSNQLMLSIPSYRVSLDTARFTLTQPATAFFGAGVDNYSALFTKAKTSAYNHMPLWDMTFMHGRSFMLDLWAETGLFGSLLFLLFIIGMFHYCDKIKGRILIIYIVLMLFLFPASLALLFLFFTTASLVCVHGEKEKTIRAPFFPIALGACFSFLLVTFTAYVLVRAYRAEYYYHQVLLNASRNQSQDTYRHLHKAVMLNPYNESFRMRLAQFYLLIAQNSAEKKGEKISQSDTHMVAQAIESAIKQGKAASALNPYKAMNWENLGDMYASIIGPVRGADAWAVASYQRAIQADPLSPHLRLKSGGVYYRAHHYAEAKKYFRQAIALKNNWSNARYNLAWVLFQEKNYQEAVNELEKTRALLPTNSAEFQKITKELAEFKKSI